VHLACKLLLIQLEIIPLGRTSDGSPESEIFLRSIQPIQVVYSVSVCPVSFKLLDKTSVVSSDFSPASGEDVAVSTNSSSSLTITLSSLPPLITSPPSVLGDGEASEPVERSLATLSSSNANQLEFVKSEPLHVC